MELTYALQIAADYYREGYFTPEYAAQRITEIQDLMREHTTASDEWIKISIPALRAKS